MTCNSLSEISDTFRFLFLQGALAKINRVLVKAPGTMDTKGFRSQGYLVVPLRDEPEIKAAEEFLRWLPDLPGRPQTVVEEYRQRGQDLPPLASPS
jgi:hypothetical protein